MILPFFPFGPRVRIFSITHPQNLCSPQASAYFPLSYCTSIDESNALADNSTYRNQRIFRQHQDYELITPNNSTTKTYSLPFSRKVFTRLFTGLFLQFYESPFPKIQTIEYKNKRVVSMERFEK